MKKINSIKIGNTTFNLNEKMTKTQFKKGFRGTLGVDLEKAWTMIQKAKKNK